MFSNEWCEVFEINLHVSYELKIFDETLPFFGRDIRTLIQLWKFVLKGEFKHLALAHFRFNLNFL